MRRLFLSGLCCVGVSSLYPLAMNAQIILLESSGASGMHLLKLRDNSELSIPPWEDIQRTIEWLNGKSTLMPSTSDTLTHQLDTSIDKFLRERQFTPTQNSLLEKIEIWDRTNP